MKRLAPVALVVVAGSAAFADPEPNPRVAVEVGKIVEQNVGYTRGGWFCDDPSLITAQLITRDDTNYWVVTGVKAGTTVCRVGDQYPKPYLLFDLVVTAAKPAKPAPKQVH